MAPKSTKRKAIQSGSLVVGPNKRLATQTEFNSFLKGAEKLADAWFNDQARDGKDTSSARPTPSAAPPSPEYRPASPELLEDSPKTKKKKQRETSLPTLPPLPLKSMPKPDPNSPVYRPSTPPPEEEKKKRKTKQVSPAFSECASSPRSQEFDPDASTSSSSSSSSASSASSSSSSASSSAAAAIAAAATSKTEAKNSKQNGKDAESEDDDDDRYDTKTMQVIRKKLGPIVSNKVCIRLNEPPNYDQTWGFAKYCSILQILKGVDLQKFQEDVVRVKSAGDLLELDQPLCGQGRVLEMDMVEKLAELTGEVTGQELWKRSIQGYETSPYSRPTANAALAFDVQRFLDKQKAASVEGQGSD
jgi:hypothetical protein